MIIEFQLQRTFFEHIHFESSNGLSDTHETTQKAGHTKPSQKSETETSNEKNKR